MVESELGQIKLYIWCCSAASLRRKAALELFCHLSLRTRNAFTTTPLLLRCYMVIIRSRPPLLFIYQLEKPATPLPWKSHLCWLLVVFRWPTGVFQDPVTSQRGVVTAWTSHPAGMLGVVSGETFNQRGQQRPAFYPGVRLLLNNLIILHGISLSRSPKWTHSCVLMFVKSKM